MPLVSRDTPDTDFTVDVLIIGAGASGLTAALAAAEQGAEVVILERDASPSGSTSMSSGFVPAPGITREPFEAIARDGLTLHGYVTRRAGAAASRAASNSAMTVCPLYRMISP